MFNLQLTNPVAHRFDSPEIAQLHTVKPGTYPVHHHLVTERVQPSKKRSVTVFIVVLFELVWRFSYGLL
jgi:hypothetical protein